MSRLIQGSGGLGRLAMVAAALILAATGITVGVSAVTDNASAASCYGGAKSWSRPWSGTTFYTPSSGTWTTSSRCTDINLKLTSGVVKDVRVCFFPSSGGMSCQSSYKTVKQGAGWKVIASNGKDGTKFKFQFRNKVGACSGYAAF